MIDPRDKQDNDSDERYEDTNNLAGNAGGNVDDEDYIELNSKNAASGTLNDDFDGEDDEGTEGPLSDYEGLDDDEDFVDDDE